MHPVSNTVDNESIRPMHGVKSQATAKGLSGKILVALQPNQSIYSFKEQDKKAHAALTIDQNT